MRLELAKSILRQHWRGLGHSTAAITVRLQRMHVGDIGPAAWAVLNPDRVKRRSSCTLLPQRGVTRLTVPHNQGTRNS